MNRIASSLLCTLILYSAAPAFQIPAGHKAAADPVIREILACRFDNAMSLSSKALEADAGNAMAAVLRLVAAGMRDVDADYTVDSAGFTRSFERAKNAVDAYETQNGVSSYSKTLRGFTLGIHASFHLKNKSYIAAAGTGMDAIKLMREARELDPANTEVNFFLGLYEFALADLKKKVWGVTFWLPGTKQNGIAQLEQGAKTAKLTNTAAALALSDVYLQEKQPDKSRDIIHRLKKEIPESRFLMWAEAKYFEDRKIHKHAAETYGKLAGSYEKDKYGAYNAAVTRNRQAHIYNKSGDTQLAIDACKRVIERGSVGNDKRIQGIVRDSEKLLARLEKK